MTAPIRPTLRSPRAGITWSEELRRYRDERTGRIVPAARVRSALDLSIEAYKPTVRELATQLRAGQLSLRGWQLGMEVAIKDANLLGAAGAVGGWEQLRTNPSALGRVGREIRAQYEFLDGFVQDIASGKQKLDGSLTNRATMYVDNARVSYEAQRTAEDRAAGLDQERSIRHASDSCEGCIREERRGWVAVGEIVPIGDRNCLTRCRCSIERRRSTPEPEPPRKPSRRSPATRRQRERELIGT